MTIMKVITIIPIPQQPDKATIIGMSGSGKTTLMKYIIDHSNYKNGFIIDTVNYFSNLINSRFDIDYSGIIGKYHNYSIVKIHSELQLEGLIRYLRKKLPNRPYFLIIDEIDRYTNPNHLMRYTKIYLEEGRNYNQGGLFSVRRIGFLNKSILGNSKFIYIFKTNNVNDKNYLSNITGLNFNNLEWSNSHSFHVFNLLSSEYLGEFLLKL